MSIEGDAVTDGAGTLYSSAATEGIVHRNAPIAPAKSCRREETSCQKLPSYSLEILSPEATKIQRRCKLPRVMPRKMKVKVSEGDVSKVDVDAAFLSLLVAKTGICKRPTGIFK
ncbi:hypothetical protein Q8A73_011199 [Channa argus]|nr:hypothetical protein Q8A73_011199 [Channa argus]